MDLFVTPAEATAHDFAFPVKCAFPSPPALALSTDIFDRFISRNNLLEFAMHCNDETRIKKRFLIKSPLPASLTEPASLAFLAEVTYPLGGAIFEPVLEETPQYQPFTGVYETFMLGNHQLESRCGSRSLTEAIKRIYASTFSQHAKAYVRATPYRPKRKDGKRNCLQQVVGGLPGQPDSSTFLSRFFRGRAFQ